MDELFAEEYKYCGEHLCSMLTDVIQKVWQIDEVLPNCRKRIMEVPFNFIRGNDV